MFITIKSYGVQGEQTLYGIVRRVFLQRCHGGCFHIHRHHRAAKFLDYGKADNARARTHIARHARGELGGVDHRKCFHHPACGGVCAIAKGVGASGDINWFVHDNLWLVE
jgi:hypothetical protein